MKIIEIVAKVLLAISGILAFSPLVFLFIDNKNLKKGKEVKWLSLRAFKVYPYIVGMMILYNILQLILGHYFLFFTNVIITFIFLKKRMKTLWKKINAKHQRIYYENDVLVYNLPKRKYRKKKEKVYGIKAKKRG